MSYHNFESNSQFFHTTLTKAQVTQLVECNIEAVVVVSSTLTLGNEYAEMADRFRLGRNGVKTV